MNDASATARRPARAWVLVGVWVTLLIAAAPAGARGMRGHQRPPSLERLLEQHSERLGLDADAMARIREIAEASRERQRESRERLQDLRDEMRALIEAEPPDEAALMRQAEAIGRVETEASKERLTAMLRIRELLTPEQRAELVSLRSGRSARHHAEVREACGPEIEQHCPDIESGPPLLGCLREQREELSDTCRDATRRLRRSGFHGER